MARIDVRVQEHLQVLIKGGPGRPDRPAWIEGLSLSGGLIKKASLEQGQALELRILRGPEAELSGIVVRAEDGNAAVRFYYPDLSKMAAAWKLVRALLSQGPSCPYCGKERSGGEEYCRSCGNYLAFEDGAYLDNHLKKTFLSRVASRAGELDGKQIGAVIRHIDSEILKQKTGVEEAEFVGASKCMLEIFSMIRKVATTDISVLILGESGTGKELTAAAIHERSGRKDKPFIAINCAAIPEGLLEAELFGYERGSFTGAYASRKGKFEEADGGTIFLDEIGDLPHSLQSKLLRFLEKKTVERIGSKGGKTVDARIIAATNCQVEEAVEKGRFRKDLFYRLNAFTINLPPLRDRGADKILLARYFLRKFSREQVCGTKEFSPLAVRAIEGHGWPGNVREMINRIRSALVMSSGP